MRDAISTPLQPTDSLDDYDELDDDEQDEILPIPTPSFRPARPLKDIPEQNDSEDEPLDVFLTSHGEREQPSCSCKKKRSKPRPLTDGFTDLTDSERTLLMEQADARYRAAHREQPRKYGYNSFIHEPSPLFDHHEEVMPARQVFEYATEALSFIQPHH